MADTATPAEPEAPAAPAAPAKGKAAAAPAAVVEEVVEEVQHVWVALKDFVARHQTQLRSCTAGDEIEHTIGADLAAKGAPVRPKE